MSDWSSDVGSSDLAVAVRAVNARIADYVAERVKQRPQDSVILASGATLDAPRFEPCGDKPFAAVFDADETLIWNLGATRYMGERGIGFDPKIWDSWEKTGAGAAKSLPGTAAMVSAFRPPGTAVTHNTNRRPAQRGCGKGGGL